MSDEFEHDHVFKHKMEEIEFKLTYVDANTGEWLDFAGNGAPTTDEEAEHVLPRPPKYSRDALDFYYRFRAQKQTIMESIRSTFMALDEAGLL